MFTKFRYSVYLLLVVCCLSYAGDVLWTNGGADDSWFGGDNWSTGVVPQSTEDIRIVVFSPQVAPRIGENQTAQCRAFKLRDGDMLVESGELVVNYWGGAGSWGGTNGQLTLSGNAVLDVAAQFHVGYAQQGLLHVKNNAEAYLNSGLTIGKTDGVTPGVGHVQLDGGTINAAYIEIYNDGVNSTGTIDIVKGKIIIDANAISEIQDYIDNDAISGYWGSAGASLNVACIDDVTTVTAAIGREYVTANNFYPADKAVNVGRDCELSWSGSELATNHDLYIGMDFNEVNDANFSSYCSKGRFDVNSFSCGRLNVGQNYYWRIDEVRGDIVWKGDVLNFQTPVYSSGDFNMDFRVDFSDYGEFAKSWLSVSGEPLFDDIYDLRNDDTVNLPDLGLFTDDWLIESPIEVAISVNSSEIQHGVSEYIIGMNMSYWRDTDVRWQNGVIASRFSDVNTAVLRWPGGGEVDGYHWSTCPGTPKWKDEWETDPGSDRYFADKHECQNPEFMDVNEFLYWCYDVIGAEAAIGINYESGWRYDRLQDSVDEAVALVEHIQNLGYDVKYYYLGNETYGGTISPEDYAVVINIFASAMKTVKPDINIMPNMPSETSASWVKSRYRGILAGADPNIDQMDAHWYWARMHTTWEGWLEQVPLRNDFHSYVGPSYVDEITGWYDDIHSFGYDANLCVMEWSAGIADVDTWREDELSAFQCALIGSEMFLHFMQGDVFMTAHYPAAFTPMLSRNPKRMLIDDYTLEPRPIHAAFKLFSYAPGNDVVACSSSRADAPTVAVMKKDGTCLWIYVLNKTHQMRVTELGLSDKNYSNIEAISLVPMTDEHGDLSINQEPNFNTAGEKNLFALPAYSLTMIRVNY
jgi:hypothetical protein